MKLLISEVLVDEKSYKLLLQHICEDIPTSAWKMDTSGLVLPPPDTVDAVHILSAPTAAKDTDKRNVMIILINPGIPSYVTECHEVIQTRVTTEMGQLEKMFNTLPTTDDRDVEDSGVVSIEQAGETVTTILKSIATGGAEKNITLKDYLYENLTNPQIPSLDMKPDSLKEFGTVINRFRISLQVLLDDPKKCKLVFVKDTFHSAFVDMLAFDIRRIKMIISMWSPTVMTPKAAEDGFKVVDTMSYKYQRLLCNPAERKSEEEMETGQAIIIMGWLMARVVKDSKNALQCLSYINLLFVFKKRYFKDVYANTVLSHGAWTYMEHLGSLVEKEYGSITWNQEAMSFVFN